MSESGQGDRAESRERSEPRTLLEWIGQHRYATSITACFFVAGLFFGPYAFPELPLSRTLIGGAFFGAFCAMCVVLPRVLDGPADDDRH